MSEKVKCAKLMHTKYFSVSNHSSSWLRFSTFIALLFRGDGKTVSEGDKTGETLSKQLFSLQIHQKLRYALLGTTPKNDISRLHLNDCALMQGGK